MSEELTTLLSPNILIIGLDTSFSFSSFVKEKFSTKILFSFN